MRKWLIRTSDGQIFGPIPKQKVIELYQNKTISPDDEICMGNSYWFYIRETELLEKYLLGDEGHPLSPLANAPKSGKKADLAQEGVKFPDSNDPNGTESTTQHPTALEISKTVLNQKNRRTSHHPRPLSTKNNQKNREGIQYPSNDDLDYPDKGKKQVSFPASGNDERRLSPAPSPRSGPQKDDRYLIILLIIVLAILGFVLKKYTRIFYFIGGLIWGSEANASPALLSAYHEKVIFQSDRGKLLGKVGLNGITFDIHLNKKLDQCLLFEKTSFPMVWYLTEENHSIDQCTSASTDALTMAHLSRISSHKDSLGMVKRAAEIWGPTRSKRIIEIHQIKKKSRKKIIIENALEKTNSFLGGADQLQAKEILRILNQAENHLLSKMARMAISYKLGNNGRSHTLLRSIWSRDKDFFLITGEQQAQTHNQQKLEQQLITLMKFLARQLAQNEWRFLTLYLKYYWPKLINNHFPTSFSLNEVRKFGQTFRWGIPFPALWVEEFQKRSTQNDIQQYLANIFNNSHSPKLWRNHFWLFAFFTPSQPEVRHFIKAEMARLQTSQSPYDRFLFLKVLDNDRLYGLIKGHLKLRSPLFNLKRKTFRSMLEKDHIINFSLLHLLTLGDRNEDLLWWKIL